MTKLIFTRRFSMAHRLIKGDPYSKCNGIHGHNENVVVTCIPRAPFVAGPNMSVDFGTAKSVWHHFVDNALDHSLQLGSTDPLVAYFQANEPQRLNRLMVTEGDPTTEMLCMVLARKFQALCGSILALESIAIEETPTNTVSLMPLVIGSSIQNPPPDWSFQIASINTRHWWDRPDLTLNDLHNCSPSEA